MKNSAIANENESQNKNESQLLGILRANTIAQECFYLLSFSS